MNAEVLQVVSAAVLTKPETDNSIKANQPESYPTRSIENSVTDMFIPVVVKEWMTSCPIIAPSMHSDELVNLFRRKGQVDCVVVCNDGNRPVGLIMKDRFFRMLGSLYGMSLFGHKPISAIMDHEPLIVELSTPPQELIDRALSRAEQSFYDAVLLTDKGKFVGVLTVNDLLNVSRLLQREAVSRQLRTIKDTESMIGSIHQSVTNVSEATKDVQTCSERIAEITDQGRNELNDMLQLFKLWSTNAAEQEKAVNVLTDRTNAVDGIIRLIGELAEQSNLLAVNATIEAARAGEHGKGFGVVADEMRNLADQTKRSASQITTLIKSMTEAVRGATGLVSEGKKGADQGFSHVKRTEDTFAQLWSSSELNHEASSRLTAASTDAMKVSNEVRKEFHKLVSQMNS